MPLRWASRTPRGTCDGEPVGNRQTAGRVRDVYYKFTMNLRDLKSGRLLWADEQEIRKVKTRAMIGG